MKKGKTVYGKLASKYWIVDKIKLSIKDTTSIENNRSYLTQIIK